MKMNEIIYTDGTREYIPGTLSLTEKQGKVGGLIEYVHLPDGTTMVVNEQGIINGLNVNKDASIIADRPIMGTAILTTEIQ